MYDLTVIGDDLASHVAAAYASHHGLSTLLIAETGLGGLHLIDDFVFNIDPMPIGGFGPDQFGSRLFDEMGIELPADYCSSLNPAIQIILPEHRIDIFNDHEALLSEFIREFPELATDIRDYFDMASDTSEVFQRWMSQYSLLQPRKVSEYFSYLKLFPHVFRYKFGASKYDRMLSQNASFEKLWEALYAMVSFNNDDLFTFASAYQYLTPLRGVVSFQQGKQFLYNSLIKKLENTNGLYLTQYEISSIAQNKKSIELEIKAPDGSVTKMTSRHLIISTKSDKLDFLRGKYKYLNFSDRLRPANILFYPFTLFLGIDPTCLPPTIARHVAVVPDIARGIFDDNLLILETSSPEQEHHSLDAGPSLTVTVFLPDEKNRWTREALKTQASNILDRLDGFLPFLKEGIILNSIDKSIDISLACRKVVNPKYKISNGLFTSFSAKSFKTRFHNVFLTGASLLSDAGCMAEMISGKNAALHVIGQKE